MNIDSKLVGINELAKQLEEINKGVEEASAKEVSKQAELVRDAIRDRAPRGPSGNLKRSAIAKEIRGKANNPIAIAGIDRKIAPHAHMVEFGTVKMSARPFFRLAVDSMVDKVQASLRGSAKRAIEETV